MGILTEKHFEQIEHLLQQDARDAKYSKEDEEKAMKALQEVTEIIDNMGPVPQGAIVYLEKKLAELLDKKDNMFQSAPIGARAEISNEGHLFIEQSEFCHPYNRKYCRKPGKNWTQYLEGLYSFPDSFLYRKNNQIAELRAESYDNLSLQKTACSVIQDEETCNAFPKTQYRYCKFDTDTQTCKAKLENTANFNDLVQWLLRNPVQLSGLVPLLIYYNVRNPTEGFMFSIRAATIILTIYELIQAERQGGDVGTRTTTFLNILSQFFYQEILHE